MNAVLYREYKFKFYLNANHFITINGKQGEVHPHTWEFAFDIVMDNDEFVQFNQYEKAIDAYFDKYQNKVMNDFAPFDALNPTLENMSEFFIQEIYEIISSMGGSLVKMESSETPTRSYVLSFERDGNFIDNLLKKEEEKVDEIVENVVDWIMDEEHED